MKIIFMGTPEPAVSVLRALLDADHEILRVVTQPDRPKGRGRKMAFSPVKDFALLNDLPVDQPEKISGNRNFISRIASLKPDIIVVVAYGKLLPAEILELPKHGCLNVHASLLPQYRGAAPMQWALLNGEKESGVTIMRIDASLDTGDIILQKKIGITEDDDVLSLSKKMFAAGSALLLEALERIKKGKAKYLPQENSEATYAPAVVRENGQIDWQKSAPEIHNLVRAMVPWPGAYTFYKGKLLKIWRSERHAPDLDTGPRSAGSVVGIVKQVGFVVSSGSGNLLVREVQSEGKKRISAYDFVIGHDVKIGETLPS
jgi:methionyl-tRNA formyltransferase